jgi:hypothetical protein
MTRSTLIAAWLSLGLFAAAATASGADINWDRFAQIEVVEVLSTNDDDSTRTTKVWLAVVDGQGYIRTGNTGWGKNVVRDPEIVLRVGQEELPLRVHFVEDEGLRERVVRAFREKYGFEDKLISVVRGSNPKIMRLHSRLARKPR